MALPIFNISTLSGRGIFAVTVGRKCFYKRIFGIGRHNRDKRKGDASKIENNTKLTRGSGRNPIQAELPYSDVSHECSVIAASTVTTLRVARSEISSVVECKVIFVVECKVVSVVKRKVVSIRMGTTMTALASL